MCVCMCVLFSCTFSCLLDWLCELLGCALLPCCVCVYVLTHEDLALLVVRSTTTSLLTGVHAPFHSSRACNPRFDLGWETNESPLHPTSGKNSKRSFSPGFGQLATKVVCSALPCGVKMCYFLRMKERTRECGTKYE
jgi:hypothetical protein